jgi:hypothetical protein
MIRYVGGPWNGRQRNIDRSPHLLASPVALPVDRRGGDWPSRERLAVYQLHNQNGDWTYCHLHTADAEDLGVASLENEAQLPEQLTPV